MTYDVAGAFEKLEEDPFEHRHELADGRCMTCSYVDETVREAYSDDMPEPAGYDAEYDRYDDIW